MATKISQLPTDSAVTGVELLTGIDGTTNKNISVQQIADFANIAAATDATTKADAAEAAANAYTDDAVAGIGGGTVDLSTPTTFDGTIRLDVLNRTATVDAADITDPITFDPTDAANGAGYTLGVIADGVTAEPDVSDFVELENPVAYDTTSGNATAYIFNRVLGVNVVGRIKLGVLPAGPTQLATPTLSLTVDSDTAITADWTNVANESSYQVQIATNAGFTTGLQTATPAANDTSHQFTGLTASTLYYARVKAVGDGVTYLDSAYGTDSDTTQAPGLIQLSTPTLTMTVDSDTEITFDWTNVANESSFYVQIATNVGFTTGVQTATPVANDLQHQFTGLTAATLYYGRVKAVGDGVTYSDSAYGTDSDTTDAAPAVTLNAPTSFAAGTPTADGAPFTWADNNTTPAESSHLIQIAIAADTTYAGTLVTRTPAANATSEPAGSGLTDSTAYRARIKAVGNGTSTLDSAWSSEVTFTTAAAGGLAPLDFTGSSDIIASGSDWVPDPASGNPAYGNLGKANVAINAGADGRFGALYLTSPAGTQGITLGVNNTNTEIPYTSFIAGWASAGLNIHKIDDAGLSGSPIATVADGDYVSLARISGVWKLQKSTAQTGPWTDLATLTVTSAAGKKYVVSDLPNGSSPPAIIHDAFGEDLVP